jgi:hypothetical protein
MANKTKPKTKAKSGKPKNIPDAFKTVAEVLAAIDDEQTRADSKALAALMKRITGKPPKIWNAGTIGFDSYHYKYATGREGDRFVLGFYPRKGKFTIYLMDGTGRHAKLLAKLGKHTVSRVCLYFKQLGDLDPDVLEKILTQSHAYIKAQDGRMGSVQEGWR